MKRIVLLWILALLAAGTAQAQLARPGEYVVFRSDQGLIQEKDLASVKALGVHGLEVFAQYPRVLGVRADARVAGLLAAQGLQVEPNYLYRPAAGAYSGWHLDRVAQRTPWTPGASPGAPDPRFSGTLYVLDTFAYDPAGELGDRLVHGPDFIGTDDRNFECRQHGTWVADLAGGKTFGISTRIRIVTIRIVTCDFWVTDLATRAAFDWLRDEGVQRYGAGVVNMSWGAQGFASNPYTSAFKALREAGFLLVAAAMNDGGDASEVMPCAFADLCVGATNVNDARASFSNYGPAVDLFAPGEAVSAIGPEGQVANLSGTSASTPLVSATLLRLQGLFPQLPSSRLIALILANATRDALAGNLGAGSPNLLLYAGPVTENAGAGRFEYSRRKKQLTASTQVGLNGRATLSQWVDFYRGARGANGKCKGKPFARGTVDADGGASASTRGGLASASRVCFATELGGVFESRVSVVP